MNCIDHKSLIEKKFLDCLSEEINELYALILYDCRPNRNTKENFELITRTAQLFAEILKYGNNEEKFKELLASSIEGGDQFAEKYELFFVIRNILAHFPIFGSWDEVCIDSELLNWNAKSGGKIEKFFQKNEGKTLKYSIYTRVDYFYDKTKEFEITIPKLGSNKIYLRDIISLDDVLWLFTLAGYYLEWKKYKINPDESKYLGMISA